MEQIESTGEILEELDLADGDGMSIAYHRWIAGDFGDDVVVAPASRMD